MRYFNRHHFAFLPLLSLLAMGPSAIEAKFVNRSIASIEVSQSEPAIDISSLVNDPFSNPKHSPIPKFDLLKKNENQSELLVINDKKIVATADKSEPKEILDVSSEIAEDKVSEVRSVEEPKEKIESEAVAESEVPKIEEVAEVVSESKDIIVKEKEASEVVAEVEDSKEKKEKVAKDCDHGESNAVLTAQVEKLMTDQTLILQALLNMTQTMMGLIQNQQQNQMPNPYYANGNGFSAQTPYQYNQPTTAGNWVYHPSGFQPSQINIFAQPQQVQGGFYPDQAHQPQSGWNLRPQMNFNQDNRYAPPSMMPGTFGNEAFSFNMVPNPSQILQS